MLWSITTIQIVNLFSLIELIKIFSSSQDNGLTLDNTMVMDLNLFVVG
jgi:hypothetical protein